MTENSNISTEISLLLADMRERLEFFSELGIESFETEFVSEKLVQKDGFTVSKVVSGSNPPTLSPRVMPENLNLNAPPKKDLSKTATNPLLRNALAATKLSNISRQTFRNSSNETLPTSDILKSVVPTSNSEEIKKTMANDSLFGDLTPDKKLPESSETIDEIRADIGDCVRCRLCEGRTKIVHSTGNLQSKLMFIGEAPGADEDLQGFPFVGRAGQLLTKIIEAIGMKREEVFIGNINRCRPPQNRAPQADEVKMCKPFLLREIAVVKPEIIVVLGNTATQNLLDTKIGISKLRGNFQDYYGVKVMPTFHPAYLLRDPSKKRETWEDMKKVRDELTKEK